jgi:hypothetical protein
MPALLCFRPLTRRWGDDAQQYEGFAPSSESVLETTKDGFSYVSPAKFKAAFAHDVSDT